MKVKANGINFNCEIEGKRGAPWVVFSNSLATNLSMWDDQAAALADKLPHPALRPARPRRHRRARRQVQLRPAGRRRDRSVRRAGDRARAFRRHVDGRHDRRSRSPSSIPTGSTASCPAIAARPRRRNPHSNGKSASPSCARSGMEALVEPTVGRWFPPEFLAARASRPLDKVREMIRTTPVERASSAAPRRSPIST